MSFQQGTVTKKLVTSIAYMDTREINKGLVDVGMDGGFDGLMVAVKRYKPTTQPQYHHFTNENALQTLVVDTVTSGSGTPTVVMTVTTTGFARRGDTFLFSNGKVGMISTAITTNAGKDSFTIISVDGTNLTVAATNIIAPVGLVVGEKSLAVSALVYGQVKYFNQIQTLRDKVSMTDIQMKSTVEVGNGYYMYTQTAEQVKSFKLKLSAMLVAGVKSVNQYGTASSSLNDKDGNSVQTTGGAYNEINTYGIADTVATPDTVVNADIDDLLDQILAVKGPSAYLALCPDRAWRKYDDFFKNLGSAGVTSARLNMDGNDVDYNVSSFKKGKFNIEFGSLPILDHPEIFNFTGSSNVGKSIMGIPKDKVKVEGSDGASLIAPRMGVRYIPNPKASMNQGTEYVQEFETGGLAKVATSDEQVLDVHYIARQGMEMLGTKQCFRQIVLA